MNNLKHGSVLILCLFGSENLHERQNVHAGSKPEEIMPKSSSSIYLLVELPQYSTNDKVIC